MIAIFNAHIVIISPLSSLRKISPKCIQLSLRFLKICSLAALYPGKKLLPKIKTLIFFSVFQLLKYLCFMDLATFYLVFGLVIFFSFLIHKTSDKSFSSLEKISLSPRFCWALTGKTPSSWKTWADSASVYQ